MQRNIITSYGLAGFIKAVIAIIIFYFFTEPLIAQNTRYRFENFTDEHGLANRIINAIVQDEQGFIWIGSGEGLTRYDGYEFIVYRHDDNNKYSISDNEVYALCSDDNDALWVGTRNGLNKYDAVNDRFETFLHEPANNNSPAANEVYALAKDSSGNIWVGTLGGGVDVLHQLPSSVTGKRTYSFAHYRHNDNDSNTLSNDQVFSIGIDKYNKAWIGTASGLNIVDANAKKITRIYNDASNINSIKSSVVNKIYINGQDVWLCGKDMLDRISISAGIQSSNNIKAEHFLQEIGNTKANSAFILNDFLKDKNNNAWIATQDNGLLKINLKNAGDKFVTEQFINDTRFPFSLASSVVYSLLEDRSGVIWIGTAKGLSKYVPSKSAFDENIFLNNLTPANNGFVMGLLYDQENRLFIATDSDTLHVFDNDFQLKHISVPSIEKNAEQLNTIYQSSIGDIYIGTLHSGLYIIPASLKNIETTSQWINISKKKYADFPSNNIYAIGEDKNGIIWIGTYAGLCSYNPVSRTLLPVYVSPERKIISDFIIRSISVDDKNNVWCGTDNGINVFKNAVLKYQFKHDPANSNSLSNNRATSVFTGRNKNIWVGTKAGLGYFDAAANSFHRIQPQDGFIADGIESITQDKAGNIWAATNHGLLKYAISETRFYHYETADGLYNSQFISNAVCIDKKGRLYFGTNNGIISFNPENIRQNNFIPPVVITGIRIFDKPIQSLGDSVLLNLYNQQKKLLLQYNQNFFTFEFAALNYINSTANRYAYQLQGVDRQWVNAGTQRSAGYTDIKPGHYTFRVKASNNDGIWNENAATIEVIILTPWWQSWWFFTLCCLAAGAVVYIIFRVRVKQIIKLYSLRSNIAKDLHDDVGSALSSIAMLSRIAQEGKVNAHLKTEEIFSRIGDTSKRMIDLMDDIVWSVNPDNDRFSNMLVRMREYASEMLEPNNIDFSFKVDERIDELRIPMQMRKDYFLIFKEAVNNICKYAQCNEASICIEKINRNIVTSISDNGRGFDESVIHSGNGLKNMQARAAILKGHLNIKTTQGEGTLVLLVIPLA